MNSRLRTCVVTLALLALPSGALAVENIWPHAAGPPLRFGWGSVGYEGFDAIPDGAGGFYAAMDNSYEAWVQHVLPSGRLAWPFYEVELGLGGGGYGQPAISTDGFGGVLVAWEAHGGSPTQELRVQRVLASGTLAPGWPDGGVPVAPSSDYDYYCDVVPDGSGGALVSYIRSGPYRVHVSHLLADGTLDPNWPVDGVAVQLSGSTSSRPQLFPDGQGGAIVLYLDETPPRSLIAARVTAAGQANPGNFSGGLLLGYSTGMNFAGELAANGKVHVAWTDSRTGQPEVYVTSVNHFGYGLDTDLFGRQLTTTPLASESYPVLATDGAGNTVVAWISGSQLLGARLKLDLSTHPAWPEGGVVVSPNGGGGPYFPSVASDGAGGLLLTWLDSWAPQALWAQRLDPDGTRPSGWSPNGNVLSTSVLINSWPVTIHDGERGIIGAFGDQARLAANRLRWDGTHGLLEQTVLLQLADVPNDQGGRLALQWRASEIDTLPSNAVGSYFVWRRMPELAARARLERGARMLRDHESAAAAEPGAIRVTESAASIQAYWEYLGHTPARAWTGYGMTVSTNSDQLGPGAPAPWEVFMVESVSPAGVVIATSVPDSGYSVDNLSPSPPAAFAAVRAGGATHLHWLPSGESDFREYRLHRGPDVGFVPDDANLVAVLPDTGHVDAGPAGACYKLAALDVHGNASTYAVVHAGQTVDVGAAPAGELSFSPVRPNPARNRATLAFVLPRAGHVRLAVYDVSGRLARTLVDASLAAGTHHESWDLRDESGVALAPGVYLARLETAAGTRVRRVAVIE